MADKHFKVKNNVQVSDLTTAGPVTVNASGVLESHTTLAIEKGGTGQTTAANAINALLPSQTNNTNKVLSSNGTNVSWVNNGAAYQTSAPSSPNVGDLWVDSDETGDSLDPYIIRRKTITATAGQTVFTTDVTFTDGYEQVYYNGVLLVRTTDYTTSGGNGSVTLLQGASAGDTIEIIASTPINLVNTLAGNSANTIIAQTASSIPLTIEGAASQSASLFNIKNNAGETRYEFLSNGTATVRATGPDQASFRIERYTDDLAVLALRSFGGTISSPTAKTNGTRIGMITAESYDGTSSPSSARIQFFVDGTVSTGNVPGAIGFNTTPVGGSHTERMRIDSNGQVGIGPIITGTFNKGLSINSEAGQYAGILLVNNSTGTTNSDGTAMYISNSNFVINNREASDISILTNNIQRIGISSNGTMALNAPSGATSPTDYAWLGLNGGPVSIRDILANGGEASDWPIPSLSIYSFDDYNENTMLSFLYRDDTNYMTDFSKWNFRLSDNSGSKTSSTSTTNLKFGGPGAMLLYTGNAERINIQNNGNINIGSSANPGDTLRFFDIYNTNSGNSAGSIIRLITNNTTNTAVTSVDIVKYRTGGFVINNNDGYTSFNTSGGERMRILGTGQVVIGNTAALNNEVFGVRSAANMQTIWIDSVEANYSTVAFGNRITRANTSAYTFLQNWSGGGSDTEHYLRGDGQAYADGSWNGGGADYAEYFEWSDGNPNNEDRRGYSVSLINDKIKVAEEGDIVFGIVSGNPSVVGDDAPMKWAGKYLKDDFGSYIRDEDGYRVLNPEYDEELEYISRESRPEWSTVGLMGKLRLRKGQVVNPNWIKMRDISAEVEEWLVR